MPTLIVVQPVTVSYTYPPSFGFPAGSRVTKTFSGYTSSGAMYNAIYLWYAQMQTKRISTVNFQ